MLVLSRQRDEIIMIGDDIEIKVVDLRGDKVRIGITAPRDVAVHRKEVYDAIQRDRRSNRVLPEEETCSTCHGGPNLPGVTCRHCRGEYPTEQTEKEKQEC